MSLYFWMWRTEGKKGVKISETIYYLHLQDSKVTTELVFYEILLLIHNNIYFVMPWMYFLVFITILRNQEVEF
jgi:hypothetical protein